ncbi:MAG: alkaline phosphatase family protein [Candidatus Hydrogenedentota bacterium]
MMFKTILCLLDGVRYDAVRLIDNWVGLPNFQNIIKNGIWFTNVFTFEPVLTNHCQSKILVGHQDYNRHQTVFDTLGQLGLRTASIGTDPYTGRGATANWDNLYDANHHYRSDQVRTDVVKEILKDFDFIYVYFVEPDEYAHVCRDAHRHIYSFQSPYIWAIKRCDERVGQIIKVAEKVCPGNYNIICLSDHGMTDGGRHSIATWTTEEVMHVTLFCSGVSFKKAMIENSRLYITDIAHGIVNLYNPEYNAHIFQNVKI